MTHRDTVADRYRVELERYPARLTNRILHRPGDLVQVNVTRNDLAETVRNRHKRLDYILFRYPARTKKRTMRCTLKTRFHRITYHVFAPNPPVIAKKTSKRVVSDPSCIDKTIIIAPCRPSQNTKTTLIRQKPNINYHQPKKKHQILPHFLLSSPDQYRTPSLPRKDL
jgi:hypothetical protein